MPGWVGRRPYPSGWPWVQPSILVSTAEDERYWANYWLDTELGEDDDSSDDYLPPEGFSSDSDASSYDSAHSMVDSVSDDAISDSEVAYITAGVLLAVSTSCFLTEVPARRCVVNSRDLPGGLDNQKVTFLMIDPESGFAPPEWQSCVGSVRTCVANFTI
ncbi:hypothetical protein C8F04DRAFT_1175074 [Mycena alexandri]|uniref:Uncharacterized protein n=1 Tax=Mycena alexandri TaxID=1745969 RepID=A0AAD6TGW0_9AGAR|nr:hypothetical protein C8F04DRAFT_1175074 [Mycena alexandri]